MFTPLLLNRSRTPGMVLCLASIFSILACVAHSGSGGNVNPSMYGSYNNYPQQQWPSQQQQQQYQYRYSEHDQYKQQEQQYQTQKAFEPAESEEPNVAVQELPPLPSGWSEHIDPSSGQPYYYNMNDGTTTWDRPPVIVNNTIVESEDTAPYPEHYVESSQTVSSLQQDYAKPVENDSVPSDGFSPAEKAPENNEDVRMSNPSSPELDHEAHNSKEENVLTSITRDEQNIRNEESWRASQGWSNENIGVAMGDLNKSPESVSPQERQQQQGWGLPPSQSDGWGIPKTPKPEVESTPPVEQKEGGARADPFRPQSDVNPFAHSQQQQHLQQQLPQQQHHQYQQPPRSIPQQHVHLPGQTRPENVPGSPDNSSGGHGSLESRSSVIQSDQRIPPVQRIPPNQQNIPPYQERQLHQSAPPRAYGQQPLPSESNRPMNQQRPPYHQSQAQMNPNPYGQQPPPQNGYMYGQRPPQQNPYGAQYEQQSNQYPGAPMYRQQPPTQGGPSNHGSQAGQGQLVSQDQQNLMKESLGKTWQSILGLRDRTKEVVESATSTVAQSAREATQTITEKGTGWWGQAKSVLGSVFESEPTSEYSLSGIYGNSPPSSSNQGQGPGYQPQYPPRYPQQQQYPPRGQGQPPIQPAQGRYPAGYTPPQPRVDNPYPYPQQRHEMPPVQRQYGPGGPQPGGVPPQNQPYDPNRPPVGYYQQQMPPSDSRMPSQQQQQQQQPRKPDDKTNPWAHPGLTSDY